MNTLSFISQEGEGRTSLMPVIDGRPLSDIVREFEAPYAEKEGHPTLAGKYSGLPAEVVRFPSRHFVGKPEPLHSAGDERVYLMDCECGCPGCWPFEAKITLSEEEVRWSDFRQPHRSSTWDYSAMPVLHFQRSQYEDALRQGEPATPV